MKHHRTSPGHGGKRTVTVASSENPVYFGQEVTFTATVTPDHGGGTMTFFRAHGRIFRNLDELCGGLTLTLTDGHWGATCTVTPPAGSYIIMADYASVGHVRTLGFLDQTVYAVPTTTTLSSSQNPSTVGQPVTFTATVTAANGAAVSGVVTFSADGTKIGGCFDKAVTRMGTSYEAICTTSSLPAGPSRIRAAFTGLPHGDFIRSVGGPLMQKVVEDPTK